MRGEQIDGERICLSLEPDEKVCFCNVLNEVRNGFAVRDFTERFGMSGAEADSLWHMLDSHSAGQRKLELSRHQLSAVGNALVESLRELGEHEFHTRVGISFSNGEEIARQVDLMLASFDSE